MPLRFVCPAIMLASLPQCPALSAAPLEAIGLLFVPSAFFYVDPPLDLDYVGAGRRMSGAVCA